MAKQTIGIGTVADDGTGDPLRTAFDKCNDNFDELYTATTYSGALVKKSVDQTTADYTTSTAVTFDAEEYDTDGYHESATNPARLTVPAAGYYQIGGMVGIASATLSIGIGTNGWPVLCAAGDYFEMALDTEADTSITVQATTTWFGIRRVELT